VAETALSIGDCKGGERNGTPTLGARGSLDLSGLELGVNGPRPTRFYELPDFLARRAVSFGAAFPCFLVPTGLSDDPRALRVIAETLSQPVCSSADGSRPTSRYR